MIRLIFSIALWACLSLTGLVFSAATTPAAADAVEDCLNAKGDVQIAGCSFIIETKQAFGLPITRKNLAIAYYNRANAYVEKGNDNKAIEDFTAAIELDPEAVRALINRANAYARKADFELAVADFNAAVKLDPNQSKIYLNRGGTYYDRGEYAKALADYDKTVELDPQNPSAHNGQGLVLIAMKEFERAMTSFNRALDLDPGFSEAARNLATARKMNKAERRG